MTKKQINIIQDTIIAEFSRLNDWYDKYEYLINLGKNFEPLDEKLKTDENSISGCQSQVWLTVEMRDKKMYFFGDSDSLIVRGMISLLLRVFNKQHPDDIVHTDLYFIDKVGLSSNLSPSRVHGLFSIVKKIKSYAKRAANTS